MSYNLAFVNSKGGCGKTTSVYSIAGELAKRIPKKNGKIVKGEKILVVDADKQRNLSFCFFGADGVTEFGERPKNTLYDFIAGEDENIIAQTLWQRRANANARYYGVDAMVADKRLANEDMLREIIEDESGDYKDYLEKLSERFKKLVEDGGYKYVLIDMPPSNKLLNRIIFGSMVDSVIIPFSSDLFCEDGYGDIIEEIDECRDANPNIKVLGVFFSRFFEGCGVDEFVKDDMIENGIGNLFKSYIPMLTDIRETPFYHRPISYYKAFSKSKSAVENLVTEILEKIQK